MHKVCFFVILSNLTFFSFSLVLLGHRTVSPGNEDTLVLEVELEVPQDQSHGHDTYMVKVILILLILYILRLV